jgi:hypothetical protein
MSKIVQPSPSCHMSDCFLRSVGTNPEGQGFLSVLSTQGSRDVQPSFHPAHKEYTGEPQAGQNWIITFTYKAFVLQY